MCNSPHSPLYPQWLEDAQHTLCHCLHSHSVRMTLGLCCNCQVPCLTLPLLHQVVSLLFCVLMVNILPTPGSVLTSSKQQHEWMSHRDAACAVPVILSPICVHCPLSFSLS
jgi:hypothetical protein